MKLFNTLLLTLFVSSTHATGTLDETDAWISNMTWELAVNNHDSVTLGTLYTEDAIVIPPSLEILDRPETIAEYWQTQMMNRTDNFRIQTINQRIEGDVLYQSAVWIATVTSNGVATELDGEMTKVMMRQQDGSWKIKLQSWN